MKGIKVNYLCFTLKHLPEASISSICLTQTRARKHQIPVKEELLERLEQSIQTIISSLPEDLQTLLHRQWQSDPREQHWPADPLLHTQRLSFQNIPAIFEPITPAQVSAHISSSGKPIHYLRGLSFWMYSTGEKQQILLLYRVLDDTWRTQKTLILWLNSFEVLS